MISKKGVPEFCPSTTTPGAWGGLHTGSTAQNPKVGASPELKIHQKSIKKKSENFGPKKIEKIEKFGTDLGWFGGDLGMVWEYFRTDFGPILKS